MFALYGNTNGVPEIAGDNYMYIVANSCIYNVMCKCQSSCDMSSLQLL